MLQKRTRVRIARNHKLRHALEVEARLVLGPKGATGRHLLQVAGRRSPGRSPSLHRMANVAARRPCPLLRLPFGGVRRSPVSGETVAGEHLLDRRPISQHFPERLETGRSRRPDEQPASDSSPVAVRGRRHRLRPLRRETVCIQERPGLANHGRMGQWAKSSEFSWAIVTLSFRALVRPKNGRGETGCPCCGASK